MKKSINQIRLELKAIADAHLQINNFAWKDFLRAYTEADLNYPLMCAYYPSGNISTNQTQIQLNIVICDRIEKDWNKNLNEVESDTLQICRDIFNVLNESSRWQRIGRVSNCIVNKFIADSGDEVAGHTMQIDFLIRDNSGVCDLPMEDYNFDQAISQGCPSVDIFNSDLSYTAEVESGDSLELPDIDYAVKNSLGTTLAGATVPSVTNIETTLNDVDNIDSDRSIVPTPAGVPFTCTPAGRPAPESDSVTKPTILDRTFDLDETDLITTSGTIAGAVDGLLITSPEPPKSYINGSTQSGITTVEVNPSDYGWTAMQEYKMIAEFEITSAPVADGQYFGIGKKGRGEKSPRNGSCIYRYSTTNALTYTEYYQSSGTSSPTPSTGDIVKLEYIVTDGQVQVLTYLNGTYQGIFSQVYTLSNDLRGRIGTWCVFVYGCDVKLKTLEIIDVAGLTCDNLITGNSEHDGWGGFASNQNRNLHDTMSKSSSYITHNHSVSSSTALDHMNCVKEKARVCIKNHIIHLGTNEKILARADATIVNEIEALANAVLALKPNVNTYIVLIPPVNGTSTTALNTLLSAMCTTNGWETIDFATWARTSDTTWDSMYTSDNIHGNLNFKQRCFEEIASNNSELLIIT